MLVLSLGDVINQRADGDVDFPVYRTCFQAPNALGWPMVSFPAGYTAGLPISAQFWGPRFAEPTLVQAMVDYQAHFPEYHTAAPPDPIFATPTPKPTPRTPAVPAPGNPTNDPILGEEAIRKALR